MSSKNKDLFDIDKNRLDEEWVNHVRQYHQEATKLADARNEHAIAKARLEVVEADLNLEVRANPAAFNLPEKITEKVIDATVVLQKKHKQAAYDLIKAKHKVDLLEAVVSAMEHRKRGLEKLVDLRLSEYFSEPRVPRAAKEEMEEARKQRIRRKAHRE